MKWNVAIKLIDLKDAVSQIGLHRISKVKLELCIVIHRVFYYKTFLIYTNFRKYCNEQWYTHLIQLFFLKKKAYRAHFQQRIQSMGLPRGAIAEGALLRMECEWPPWVLTHSILCEGCALGLSNAEANVHAIKNSSNHFLGSLRNSVQNLLLISLKPSFIPLLYRYLLVLISSLCT